MQHIDLTYQPIDLNKILEAVTHSDAGALILFVGTTRAQTVVPTSDPTKQLIQRTDFLIYEAHESMARKQLKLLAEQCHQLWPVRATAIVHRLGKVMPQEASIAIAVSSPHRAEAYEASRWLIDSIKRDVPIWKQEHYLNASPSWVHPDASDACNQIGNPS